MFVLLLLASPLLFLALLAAIHFISVILTISVILSLGLAICHLEFVYIVFFVSLIILFLNWFEPQEWLSF